jgi:hypothetical protein
MIFTDLALLTLYVAGVILFLTVPNRRKARRK